MDVYLIARADRKACLLMVHDDGIMASKVSKEIPCADHNVFVQRKT